MVKAEPFESLVSADARLQELGLQAGDRTASARTIEEVGKAKPELLPLLLKPLQPLLGDESPTVVKRAMQTLTSLYRPALALIAEQPSPVPPELLEMWERLGELKAQALSALETSASDALLHAMLTDVHSASGRTPFQQLLSSSRLGGGSPRSLRMIAQPMLDATMCHVE